ncbi:major facilitator superfamily [Heterobasidion irregulare TC 32-1]|uniref:Major facilitator superfamily n=1 Tax=Heterobasidion irregulare (strain TC 32-1) TaxID=747525 RepID=W4KMG7_HETIT|nr:major facilitator superfamily [Heterobasidion irregulare TC 32-1]ETW87033.1 major facilitator superfamily [Heterobasidion irregulare TC 32-1]
MSSSTSTDTTIIVEGGDEVLIVDWDGPDDPENPKNWPSRRKWTAAGVVAAFTFISPVTSSIGAPAGAAIARDFGIHNESLVAMTVSIFVLAYAFGPLILAPLCEVFGRSRVMMASNAVFLAWNIGCGFAQNAGQLLGFRFIAGLGGSAPLAIGGAVLSDCFRPEERGHAISLFSLAPILGPTLGPVAGAWIVERTTWRWVYWGTSIIDAVIISVAFLIFEESSVRKLLSTSLLRPFRFFVTESIVQLLGFYMAFLYVGLVTSCSIPGTIAMPIGLLLLGWGAQKHVHWIVPDIGLAFIGCGMVSNSISIQAYIVDTYKLYAASALAAVSCLRCLFAFTFPLFAPYMYNALGYGKGNTILAVVAIVLGCPA